LFGILCVISGLLTPIGTTSREALISKRTYKICSKNMRKIKMQQILLKINGTITQKKV
jgi:hypothetical protein